MASIREWWWVVTAAVVGAAVVAVAVAVHLWAGISTSDSAAFALVGLTLDVIFVATMSGRYSLLAARAAAASVKPLEATARTLTELSGREERVAEALGGLLDQVTGEARRQEFLDRLRALQSMLVAARRMVRAQAGMFSITEIRAEYLAAQGDYQAAMTRFPRDELADPIRALAGYHYSALDSAPTGNAISTLEAEIERIHGDLRA